MIAPHAGAKIDKIAGIEARGFILGRWRLPTSSPLVLCRSAKKGKLPFDTLAQTYELEYGTDEVEMHTDAISPGETRPHH